MLAAPLLLVRLGAKDVWEASEGRPLESAREMRAQGDALVQYTNGAVDLTKPPLYAWLVRLSFDVLGETEAAGRLPSVLASIGALGAVYVLGRRRGGARAGFTAALLLLTTVKFLFQARLAELETLLACAVLWAYAAFDAGVEAAPGARRDRLFAGGFAATGLAFAVKGPIALLLVLPGVAIGAIAVGRGRSLLSRACAITLPILPLVALPWYAAVVLRDPSALDTFLSYARGENVGHLHDPFYYLASWPLYGLPGVLAAIPGLALPLHAGLDPDLRRRVRLPFVAFVTTFLLLSVLHAKQTHYLIPVVFPMGCVLGGVWMDRWLASEKGPRVALALRVAAATVLVAEFVAVGWVVPGMNARQSARSFFERVGRRVPVGAELGWTVFGSHSDYLWYLPPALVGTRGLPEWLGANDDATIPKVRASLVAGPDRYAIVTASQAAALVDVAEVLERDDDVGKKGRSFVLLRAREGARGPR